MGRYTKDVILFQKVNSCNKSKFIFRESSAVDEFHFRKGISSDDGKDVTFVCDPIYEAFNADRLQSLGRMNIEAWFDSLKQKPISPLQELRSKCSDDTLVSMMKSRYCQSPADIMAWSQYMADNLDTFNAEVAQLAQASESSETESKNVE